MKNKIIDTAFNVAIVIFVLGVSFGFYKQAEANRNLNHKIEILHKHNKKISEEVDKLHKTKRLYLEQLEPKALHRIKVDFGSAAMAKRKRWLKERVAFCDGQINFLEERRCQ